jgi:AraC family transcriptional regulator
MLEIGETLSAPRYLPKSADYCEILASAAANGITADIRHYGWNRPSESTFVSDSCYIDYALARRSDRAFMISEQGRQPLIPGSLVFLPAGAQYRTHCDRSDHLSFCLGYHSRRAAALLARVAALANFLEPCLDLRNTNIERHIRSLVEEIRNPGFASEVVLELISDAVIVEIARHFGQVRENATGSDGKMAAWRLRRLKESIREGLGQSLSVAALAESCGISTRHLMRTFKNTEGVTLSGYIARERMALAKQLLAESDHPIKVVAAKCGFGTASAFSAAFSNALGQTPRQYRESQFADRSRVTGGRSN